MTEIKLFIAPGSCARVPTILLEEIGLPYSTELVRSMKG
jgi:glutathione S-transferase